MSRVRWSNIPIPEGHVILLAASVALHFWFPRQLFQLPWLQHGLGWTLLVLGLLLAAWAVLAAQNIDINRATRLIVTGPYAFSRNPMYVGWTLIYIAITVLVNTWWPLLFLPLLLTFTHVYVVRREEQRLEKRFGEEYHQYRERVRRYL